MLQIEAIDFHISEAIYKIQRNIPSAIQPRMAKLITHKIFNKNQAISMCYNDRPGIRKAIEKTIDKLVMPTLSGVTEILYDNYVFRGEDIQGIQPDIGKQKQTLFYKDYNYKKFRHPCVIEDFFVYDLENNYTKKTDLVEKDILIVDDKGVVRYLSEETFNLFEKVNIPYTIGEKVAKK